jgi:hypothetical protein
MAGGESVYVWFQRFKAPQTGKIKALALLLGQFTYGNDGYSYPELSAEIWSSLNNAPDARLGGFSTCGVTDAANYNKKNNWAIRATSDTINVEEGKYYFIKVTWTDSAAWGTGVLIGNTTQYPDGGLDITSALGTSLDYTKNLCFRIWYENDRLFKFENSKNFHKFVFHQQRSPFTEIKEVCESEGARFFQDVTGNFVFENIDHPKKGDSKKVVMEYDFDNLKDISIPYDEDSVYNKVTWQVKKRTLGGIQNTVALGNANWRNAKEVWVYSGDPIVLAPNESISIWANYSSPVLRAYAPSTGKDGELRDQAYGRIPGVWYRGGEGGGDLVNPSYLTDNDLNSFCYVTPEDGTTPKGWTLYLPSPTECDSLRLWHYGPGLRTYYNIELRYLEDEYDTQWKYLWKSSADGNYVEPGDGAGKYIAFKPRKIWAIRASCTGNSVNIGRHWCGFRIYATNGDMVGLAQSSGADLSHRLNTTLKNYSDSGLLTITNIDQTETITLDYLRIRGVPLEEKSAVVASWRDDTSIRKYGEKALTISNKYTPSYSRAMEICKSIVERYKNPTSKMILKSRALPQLELGDLIRVNHNDLGIKKIMKVTRIKHIQGLGSDMEIECREAIASEKPLEHSLAGSLGVVIEAFENYSDWTVNSDGGVTLSDDTVNFKSGTKALKVSEDVDAWANLTKSLSAPIDVSAPGRKFQVWIYVPTGQASIYLNVRISFGGTEGGTLNYDIDNLVDGWNLVSMDFSGFDGGSSDDWTDMASIGEIGIDLSNGGLIPIAISFDKLTII